MRMPFNNVPNARRRNMSAVRAKDTKPEIAVRQVMHALGYRFRLHRRNLPGCPDIVLPRHRLAVFVQGCFWHGCSDCSRGRQRPRTNSDFWEAKLAANRARDARNQLALKAANWSVIEVWECATRDPDRLRDFLHRILPDLDTHLTP